MRFAPSPTGPLHVGGVRTALYNFLFAKKNGGDFLLRIEDTDQNRYVPGAEQYIIDSLKWAGIDYDEGPGKDGGFGPYRQSERKHLYRQYADQLIEAGLAYYAFDTSEELEAMRERLKKGGKSAAKYDMFVREYMKNSLSLSSDEVKTRMDAGDPYVIRIKIPRKEEIRFHDEIRGWVSVKSEEMDDKVLFKSDGMPTYHLANIVDDHLMQITHVIRGEEWLPSAPLHHLLYQFLGWEETMPKFAHLPLILKPDPSSYVTKSTKAAFASQFHEEFHGKTEGEFGETEKIFQNIFENPKNLANALKSGKNDSGAVATVKGFLKKAMYGKLSKRDGDRLGFPVFPLSWDVPGADSITGYRESGYLPDAFTNILVMLGWNPGTNQEVFSLEELIDTFSLERVGKSGAKFDPDKARWYNQQFLRNQDDEKLAQEFMAELKADGVETSSDYVAKVCHLIKEKASFSSDFKELSGYFFSAPSEYDAKVVEKKWNSETADVFGKVADAFEALEAFENEQIEAAYKTTIEGLDDNPGKYMQVLRVLTSGKAAGPAIFDMLALLGQAEVVSRIRNGITSLSSK